MRERRGGEGAAAGEFGSPRRSEPSSLFLPSPTLSHTHVRHQIPPVVQHLEARPPHAEHAGGGVHCRKEKKKLSARVCVCVFVSRHHAHTRVLGAAASCAKGGGREGAPRRSQQKGNERKESDDETRSRGQIPLSN